MERETPLIGDEVLNRYLDDDLPADEREEVQRALKGDVEARKRLETFRATKQALPRARYYSAPAHLRAQIVAGLDRIDARKSWFSHWILQRAWFRPALIAASLVLIVVFVQMRNPPSGELSWADVFAKPTRKCHRTCFREGLGDHVVQSDPQKLKEALREWFELAVDIPDLSSQNLVLYEGHVCRFGENSIGYHIYYQDRVNGGTVSYCVIPGLDEKRSMGKPVEGHGGCFCPCEKLRVDPEDPNVRCVFWRDSLGNVCVLVDDAHEAETSILIEDFFLLDP